MASRAILRRKRSLFDSLREPNCLIRGGFSSFQYGRGPPQSNDLQESRCVINHPFGSTDSRNERGLSLVSRDGVSKVLAAAGFLRHNSFGYSGLGCGIGNGDFDSSLGIRCYLQSVSYASTATAGQPEYGRGSDRNEQLDAKQAKEASPEECDEAVEDLTEVKAKAKAKQAHESQKSTKTVMQKVWAKLLGIGPALRAVAAMSRLKILLIVSFGLS